MYGSIDQTFGRVRRQIQKRKGKLTARRAITPGPAHESEKGERQRQTRHLQTIRPVLEVLTASEAVERLEEGPTALLVFVNPSLNRVQVLRRLDGGDVQLIDPQPERIAGS